jgi:hypothetical protein
MSRANVGLYYTKNFCRLLLESVGADLKTLHYQDELGIVFDVTQFKDISSLPFYALVADQFPQPPLDLATPFYNGPVVLTDAGNEVELLHRYRKAVDQFCVENGVITEFTRLHPFLHTLEMLSQIVQITSVLSGIYVDLRQGYEAARKEYRKGHRSAVQKAAREGATFQIVEADQPHLAAFTRHYAETMQRHGTKNVDLKPPEFFQALFMRMENRALLVESYMGESLVSSSIFLNDFPCLWYYYSSSVPELLKTNAHTYAMDRMIAWGAENNYEYMLLGGGSGAYKPDDSLYKFKTGFSHREAKGHQMRKVHNSKKLEALLTAKDQYNRSLGRPVRTDYFPSYWLD